MKSSADIARPRWGPWNTAALALAAIIVGEGAGAACLYLLRDDVGAAMSGRYFDGVIVAIVTSAAAPVEIAFLALCAKIARHDSRDYLGLVMPTRRDAMIGIGCVVALALAFDAAMIATGRDIVTAFQIDTYNTARAAGLLPLYMLAVVLLAPAAEEVLFRGFLFRGWTRNPRTAPLAIGGIALLWAAMHVQYDLSGIFQVFVLGLLLGWMRWRSGSTLLTIAMHMLVNLEGTIETVLKLR